jgi:PAS domain S-box-containing protein
VPDREGQSLSPAESLRHSHERLQFFLDHAPGALAMFDREMRFLAVNRRWQTDWVADGQPLVGRCHYEVYPFITEEWRDAHRRGLAGEVIRVDQERVTLPDGSVVWLRWEVHPWHDAAGDVGGIVMFVEDVSARVQSEEAAAAARKDLASLIGTIDGIVWEADAQTFRFTFVSAQAERLLGYPVRAWLDEPGFWAQHIHPDDRDASVQFCIDSTRANRDHQFDYRMIAADGSVVWLQDRVTVHSVDGQAVTLRGVMVDITDRKRAEAALRESEERFRTLADSAPMMVWSTGADRRCDFFNRRRLEFTGQSLDPRRVDGWADGLHPDDRPTVLARYEAALGARAPFQMDYRLRRADGEYRWLSAHAVPRFDAAGAFAGYIGTGVDVTERRRAEEARQRLEAQLRQSQKMEAMGTLAGGIAHDFNNILAAIGGNIELVFMDLDAAHPAQESIGEVRRAVRRATELVQRILTFSRPETHDRQPIPLAPVVLEAIRLLRSVIPAGIELSHAIAPGLPDVVANASQIHQLIVNLATNAWQAMEGRPGRIRIGLEACSLDATAGTGPRELRPGRYVCLSVVDSGHGMDAATLDRIFEPFFTTKDAGRGTGLGLSMVHGIARGHGGAVAVESEPGRGATFRVYLPACAAAPADDGPAAPVADALRGHGERILFLDDEAPLVSLGVRLLERLGYTVAGFTSADAALAAFRHHPTAFDLVITDYNMPGMSGLDVALAAWEVRPNLPVVLASGYLRPPEIEHARALGIKATVAKPTALEELGTVVRRLLAARFDSP